MSKILLESDLLTVDLQALLNQSNKPEDAGTKGTKKDPKKDEKKITVLKNQDAENEIKKKLTLIIGKHNKLKDAEAAKVVEKLWALGEPFKKALEVLKLNIDIDQGAINPLLAFVVQKDIIENFLNPGLINISTFRALYQAVAKKYIADSEFMAINDYNIIYCKELYNKPVKDILGYLELQSKILKPSAEIYEGSTQLENRKVFLEIPGISEPEISKRAAKIKSVENNIPTVQTAKRLNSLELAKRVSGIDSEASMVHRSATELDKIVNNLNSLDDSLAAKFAALLSLSTSTASEKAKKALQQAEFKGLTQNQIASAFLKLSSKALLPKGQLQKSSADLLVDKILATLGAQANDASDKATP